eukprot:Nk52_evm12s239 gene=Nk52_evmTU12s239
MNFFKWGSGKGEEEEKEHKEHKEHKSHHKKSHKKKHKRHSKASLNSESEHDSIPSLPSAVGSKKSSIEGINGVENEDSQRESSHRMSIAGQYDVAEDDKGTSAKLQSVSKEQSGVFMSYLKAIASSKGDIAKVPSPVFLLSGYSLTEKNKHWLNYPELLCEVDGADEPRERLIRAVRWYCSHLYGSYNPNEKMKKPYNPILGEVFFSKRVDKTGRGLETHMTCEQVSHHPPVTAYYFENKAKGVCVNGSVGSKVKFRGTYVKIENKGTCRVSFMKTGEDYVFTYPVVHCRNILTGRLRIELAGTVLVTCEKTGFSAGIEFLSKPWIGGQYHQVKGKVYGSLAYLKGSSSDLRVSSDCLNEITGFWHTEMKIKDCTKPESEEETFWLVDQEQQADWEVAPIEEQAENESRRVWQGVTEGIQSGDYAYASEWKHKVETEQRELVKKREAEGTVWKPKLFTYYEDVKEWVFKEKIRPETWTSSE